MKFFVLVFIFINQTFASSNFEDFLTSKIIDVESLKIGELIEKIDQLFEGQDLLEKEMMRGIHFLEEQMIRHVKEVNDMKFKGQRFKRNALPDLCDIKSRELALDFFCDEFK